MNSELELEAFEDWLAREMPAGTVISNPKWWAPRILRAALRSSSQVPDGRNEVSTEAQPEVTGAVAYAMYERNNPENKCAFLVGDPDLEKARSYEAAYEIPLYPPSAIEAAVREKLEAAIAVALAEKVDAEATGAESDIAYNAAIDHAVEAIRALMESPHTSVEEPAN